MDETPNLRLPYILAAQSQKHVTHNEAIRALDAVVQLAVLDRDLASPPSSPAEGARYVVAPSPSGAWTGQAGRIAAFQDGAWAFYEPAEGWLAWVDDEDVLLAWDGAAWVVAGGGGINPAPMVGVNTTADSTNRLAVKSDAVLLSHDDVTPGSGDQRTVLNKSASGNTASFLFQTGFSGRAEFGLTGDDDWHVKVSANGTDWTDAAIVNAGTGRWGIGAANDFYRMSIYEAATVNVLQCKSGMAPATNSGAGIIAHVPSMPTAGDQRLGFYLFGGWDGSVGRNSVGMSGFSAEAWTAGSVQGSYLTLETTPTGSATRAARVRIGPAGQVYCPAIGTTASAANAFLDSGSTPANSLLRSTSSLRYKRDVEDMEPQRAELLLKARPIWYRSKCAADNKGWSWYGFIAEEMAEIDPRLVHWGYPEEAWVEEAVGAGDGARIERRLRPGAEKVPDGVAYDRLTVGLLSLVQTLWARVEALEGKATPPSY